MWARTVTGGDRQMLLRADDVPLDLSGQVGRSVVEVVGEKRSTWRRWNLMAEAARQTMGWRFATVEDREAITAMVADAAEQASLRLTPPELTTSSVEFRRPDGTSVFHPKHSTMFSPDTPPGRRRPPPATGPRHHRPEYRPHHRRDHHEQARRRGSDARSRPGRSFGVGRRLWPGRGCVGGACEGRRRP
ncbi:hypothetical protein [Tessaracoccus sp. OH4464_COT-324]|uniref:hypothetical protein n=1 Tax=Tessaracoccus sp. OH4464_COT-324 TaxID=2491059 RepID=UPI001F1F7108|nr:hypothetical protein [Tessaracoccus sp. OH4464_COT-324]